MGMGYQQQTTTPVLQLPLEELRKYFAPRGSPKVGIILLIVGAICFFAGFNATALLVVGILLVIVGVVLLANLQPRSNITDQQYDQWVEAQFRALIPRSLEKLNLDLGEMTREPLVVQGFVLPGMQVASKYRADELRWKVGKDGNPRYSVNVFTLFWKEDHHLAVYQGDINALNPTAHNEHMSEYFYTDIVGATTGDMQDYVTIKAQRTSYRIQYFSLRVSSGDSVGVAVGADPIDNKQNLPRFNVPNSGIDQTLAQLRMLLREKKQSRT